jgi:hypothetical protein
MDCFCETGIPFVKARFLVHVVDARSYLGNRLIRRPSNNHPTTGTSPVILGFVRTVLDASWLFRRYGSASLQLLFSMRITDDRGAVPWRIDHRRVARNPRSGGADFAGPIRTPPCTPLRRSARFQADARLRGSRLGRITRPLSEAREHRRGRIPGASNGPHQRMYDTPPRSCRGAGATT